MTVMSLIFSTIFKRSIENFPIYYLTGTIIWQFFSGATNAAMTSLVDNRSLLMKVKLPKQIFPLSRIYTALVNLGYSCVAYAVMFLVFRVSLNPTILFFPVIVFLCLLFSMGIGYFLAIVYVYFADIKYLYSVLLTVWMYLCAIFYPVESCSELMQKVINANPVYAFIAAARGCLMYGKLPDGGRMLQLALWGAGSFTVGYLYFERKQNQVMQKL